MVRQGYGVLAEYPHPPGCPADEDCAFSEGVIWVRDDLAVEVKRDRLLIQRGKAEVQVFPGEIRHLVNALAEGA